MTVFKMLSDFSMEEILVSTIPWSQFHFRNSVHWEEEPDDDDHDSDEDVEDDDDEDVGDDDHEKEIDGVKIPLKSV